MATIANPSPRKEPVSCRTLIGRRYRRASRASKNCANACPHPADVPTVKESRVRYQSCAVLSPAMYSKGVDFIGQRRCVDAVMSGLFARFGAVRNYERMFVQVRGPTEALTG